MINLSYAALFKRKVSLSLQVNNVIKTYSDALVDKFNLKIDFNITKTMGSLGDRGTITITGLPLEDAGALSTCMMNIGKEKPLRNYVQLMAGYESDYGVIFTGGVFKVSSNLDTPDMSVTLDLKPGYDASRISQIEINEKPATLMSICQKAAAVLEAPLNFTAEDKNYSEFNFKGTVFQLLDNLQRTVPYTKRIYFSDNILHVEDTGIAGTDIILISGESGLIGTPQASMQGINFKCLLMPGLKVGGMVQIQSRKLPLLNGLYKIQTLQMQGGNRSVPYFCNVFAIRI